MTKFGTALSAIALTAFAAPMASAATIVIDDFSVFTRVEDDPSGFPNSDTAGPVGDLGATRDMSVETSPDGAFAGTTFQSSGGLLSFSNEALQTGTGTLTYTFAGAEDLTDGGTNNRFFFAVNSFDLVGAAEFSLEVISDSGSGTFTETLDGSFDPNLLFSEADFNLVDFENVTSLVFTIESTTVDFDGSLASISVIPLPASALLLLGGLGGLAGMSASKRRRRKS